ncbi:MAG: beta-lactamase family protein [Bryobacteraceae bacterium]|nr:beta-lactamase family protein [Bryobacteraceae bacterium]
MLLEQRDKYLPEPTGAPASVTIRQVIRHFSGLRDWRPDRLLISS